MNITDSFINDIYDLINNDIPDRVVKQFKRCLLDYLSATYAGAQILKEKGNKLIKLLDDNSGRASVLGFNKKTSVENAAFINGLSSHIAELDDGVISGIVHPGAPVFSALLPLAQAKNIDSKDFIKGVIVGYEVSVRLSNAIQPSHKKRGYHATGTCGMIGVALGVATMLRFTKLQMKDTLSAAAVGASGSLKVLENDSELKPLNVARAAHDGILVAYVALSGFKGPDDVLSGNAGFISMMSDTWDLSYLKPNDNEFAIEKVYMKPYAACRYCHPSIDAVIELKNSQEISIEDIREINIATYYWAVANHDHTQINGVSSAKMSIPYSVAVTLATGKAGIKEFSMKYINDPDISKLTKKVSISSDEELTSQFPEKNPAVLEIITNEGKKLVVRTDNPKGDPENPLSDEEIKDKLLGSLDELMSNDTKNRLLESVWDIENQIQEFFQLI